MRSAAANTGKATIAYWVIIWSDREFVAGVQPGTKYSLSDLTDADDRNHSGSRSCKAASLLL
jgi:hypothetical protein